MPPSVPADTPVGVPWVRLESAFPSNPKTLELVEDKAFRALVGYVCGLCYSGGQGTDGFVPTYALPTLHIRPAEAGQLVDARLWVPAPGGWEVNGWAEYQLSSQEHHDRKARAKAAARLRWAKHEGRTS